MNQIRTCYFRTHTLHRSYANRTRTPLLTTSEELKSNQTLIQKLNRTEPQQLRFFPISTNRPITQLITVQIRFSLQIHVKIPSRKAFVQGCMQNIGSSCPPAHLTYMTPSCRKKIQCPFQKIKPGLALHSI